KTETRKTNVIFTQFALQQLLHFTLINSVKADYVQRNKSAFKGKIGKEVASSKVTIYDNGLLDRGIRTWKFDDEG
ncbi:MAG: TldD/PmbA family protein, partial [Candidatus Korarchaeota archaeon]|nr:TldD/PmbA family protein [Candidatus Korarchaeota archaeon]